MTRLSGSLERAVGWSVGLSKGLDTCVGALDDQADLFNALAQELNAVRALTISPRRNRSTGGHRSSGVPPTGRWGSAA